MVRRSGGVCSEASTAGGRGPSLWILVPTLLLILGGGCLYEPGKGPARRTRSQLMSSVLTVSGLQSAALAVTPSDSGVTRRYTSPADLSVVDILRMLGRLRPEHFWGMLVALGTVASLVFGAGRLSVGRERAAPLPRAQAALRNGQVQQDFRERESIRAFERYLDYAACERWSEAYALLASSKKRTLKRPEDLALDYRMTHRHDFHYYIPTSISPDHEFWDVEMSYWDFFPFLPERDRLVHLPLSKVLKEEQLEAITREAGDQLQVCHRGVNLDEPDLRNAVRVYMANVATIRDLVLRDDVIDYLGNKLHMEPNIAKETAQGKAPPEERRRLFHVHLVKEEGDWVVASYDSYLVEKR
jgi:hypothetical protein